MPVRQAAQIIVHFLRFLEAHYMNWKPVKGNWKQTKGKVQQQWGKLTNDDLDVIKGKRTELVGKIQQRYGYAREKAEQEVEAFCNSCN
jgi:uncharacterized protein YjbJ (UPF0337 family)